MSGPRTLSRYDDFDRDAERSEEVAVVNVSPHVARFEIGTSPGAAPRRYRMQPGDTLTIQGGYTRQFTGAGRQPVRPTIESLTERQVYPGGPSLPMVVGRDRAEEVRAQWKELLEKGAAPPAPVKVTMQRPDGGDPIEMMVQPAPAIMPEPVPMRSRAAVIEDDEDQSGGQLDEPPPDHNDPEPPVIGKARYTPKPFTDEEKATIRMYLGWSARFAQTDTALERAFSAIETFPAELALARAHITELQRIDAALTACEARFKADKVGTIELSQSELSRLRSRGAERVGRLATMLGVEVRDNPFSPDLPRFRAGRTGPINGGNEQMQG